MSVGDRLMLLLLSWFQSAFDDTSLFPWFVISGNKYILICMISLQNHTQTWNEKSRVRFLPYVKSILRVDVSSSHSFKQGRSPDTSATSRGLERHIDMWLLGRAPVLVHRSHKFRGGTGLGRGFHVRLYSYGYTHGNIHQTRLSIRFPRPSFRHSLIAQPMRNNYRSSPNEQLKLNTDGAMFRWRDLPRESTLIKQFRNLFVNYLAPLWHTESAHWKISMWKTEIDGWRGREYNNGRKNGANGTGETDHVFFICHDAGCHPPSKMAEALISTLASLFVRQAARTVQVSHQGRRHGALPLNENNNRAVCGYRQSSSRSPTNEMNRASPLHGFANLDYKHTCEDYIGTQPQDKSITEPITANSSPRRFPYTASPLQTSGVVGLGVRWGTGG
ncbi:hypothetical protein CBL_10979 [Carabus blaptoides fortunei]